MEDREKIMQQWDQYRAMIASGDTSSLPRDWFESIIDRIFEPEDKWQPIKTAPQNTPVLVWHLGFGMGGWNVMSFNGCSWRETVNDGRELKKGYEPTYWQPLPSPPEGET